MPSSTPSSTAGRGDLSSGNVESGDLRSPPLNENVVSMVRSSQAMSRCLSPAQPSQLPPRDTANVAKSTPPSLPTNGATIAVSSANGKNCGGGASTIDFTVHDRDDRMDIAKYQKNPGKDVARNSDNVGDEESMIEMSKLSFNQFLEEYKNEIVKECKDEMVALLSSSSPRSPPSLGATMTSTQSTGSSPYLSPLRDDYYPIQREPNRQQSAVSFSSHVSADRELIFPSRKGEVSEDVDNEGGGRGCDKDKNKTRDIYKDNDGDSGENFVERSGLDSSFYEKMVNYVNFLSPMKTVKSLLPGSINRDNANRNTAMTRSLSGGLQVVQSQTGQEYWLLEQDTFSLLFVSDYTSASFIYASCVMMMQFITLSIIAWDLLRDEDRKDGSIDNNRFNLPIFVNRQVSWGQCIALVVAVVSQDDMRNSILLLVNGYKEDQLINDFAGATKMKWIMSNALRCMEGVFVVFVSFVFIVQSDTVLDLFLNFAAVAFVAELDNLAFVLARNGYVTDTVMEQSRRIETAKIPKRTHHVTLQRILLLIPFIPLFIMWGIQFNQQRTGQRLEYTACRIVQVNLPSVVYPLDNNVKLQIEEVDNSDGSRPLGSLNFDNVTSGSNQVDDVSYKLAGTDRYVSPTFDKRTPPDIDFALFSGFYHVEFDQLVYRRPIYYENGIDDGSSGIFYYCLEEKAWVFTIGSFAQQRGGAIPNATKVFCGLGRDPDDRVGWLLVSPVTDAFTLENVPQSGWTVWTGSLQQVASSDMSIDCMDCSRDSDCGLERGECDYETLRCTCYGNTYRGPRCGALPPCQDTVFLSTPNLCPQPFRVVPRLYLQDRPVYVYEHWADIFILFLGRRWYIVQIQDSAQSHVFRGYNSTSVAMSMDDTTDGKNQWWKVDFMTHGYWDDLTNPNNIYAYSGLTDSYEPPGSDDGGPWVDGILSISAGISFEDVSFDCHGDKDVIDTCARTSTASSSGVCGMFRQCMDSKCVCSETSKPDLFP